MIRDLAHIPVAETLRQLSSARASGDLELRSGKVIKTLFFDHGRIVFAGSNLKKDRLGESLVALGRITGEEFVRATELMQADRRRRFGDALVHAGVLDKNEVGRSLSRQVNRIVLSVFELAEGVSSFEERPCAIPLEYMVSLSIYRLIHDGIRLMKSEPLVLSGLGDLDRRVTLAAVAPFEFDPDDASEEEGEILQQARRRVTLRRLAWAPGGLTFSRMRTVYALLASGVLIDESRVAEQPVVQMETGTFLLSAMRHTPNPSGRSAIRKEVDEELRRSAHLDRESWLQVSRTAPREEIVKALEEKMERYHALLEAVGDDDELKIDIEVILGRGSAMLRLARQEPTSTAEATPEEAVRTLPVSAPTPSSGGTGAGSSDFAGAAQIDHLLMEAHVRMTVSDYANAVKVYQRLVEVAPDVAAYRASLAIAMSSYPKTAKNAEREFLEAVRLDPHNADIHYQFGLYYKVMKQRARALTEMQTAVRLNPRHRLAREELEILSPKDSALLNLKKLFK